MINSQSLKVERLLNRFTRMNMCKWYVNFSCFFNVITRIMIVLLVITIIIHNCFLITIIPIEIFK